jgi:hypothetical protein
MTAEQASPLLEVALAAHRAGLAVVPPKENGTKAPDGPWKSFQATPPTEAQIRSWYANGRRGIGVLTGTPSRHLEMLELDHGGSVLWRAFLARAAELGLDALVERVVHGYVERTPGGGLHLLYRCTEPVEGNTKLAREIDAETGEVRVLFETRGEGGYVVTAPSSGSVHPSGKPWELAGGGFDTIATLTPAERRALLDLARSFDRMPEGPAAPAVRAEPAELLPTFGPTAPTSWMDATVEAFNAATTWPEILVPRGWTEMRPAGGVGLWCRPGKDPRNGHSATTNANGTDRLILWSTSVHIPGVEHADGPRSPSYDRFSVWAGYEHQGDRQAAAVAARKAGHGPPWTEHDDLDPWAMAGLERPAAPSTEPAPAPPTTGLAVRWTDRLATDMPPEPPVLVDGILRRGELVALAAPRAIGKTWIGFNLATLLARGEGRLFGRLEVRRPANVLYLQGELDEWGSATRWRHLAGGELDALAGRAQPLPRVAESFDRVRIRTITRRTTSKVDGVLMSDEHVDAVLDPRVERTIVDHGIDVVILDPWAVYFSGKENSNDEVEAALSELRAVTLRTGVAWVVIHHISAKIEQNRLTEPEDLWRGATRLADWASTRITVLPHYSEGRRREAGLSRHDARRHVDVHFLRRGLPVDDFSARRGDDGWWEAWEDPETAGEDAEGGARGVGRPPAVSVLDVVEALQRDGGEWTSVAAAAGALGVERRAAERAIQQAARLGHVELLDGPRHATITRLRDHTEATDDLRETHLRDRPARNGFAQVEMAPEQGERA